MLERLLYGPIEYLAPDTKLDAVLEITGIPSPPRPCTIHVFLEEVARGEIAELIQTANYAGCFSLPADISEQGAVQLDITAALRRAETLRPNFHITFLAESPDAVPENRLLQFESMHILHDAPHNMKLDISADVMGGLVPDRKNDTEDAD